MIRTKKEMLMRRVGRCLGIGFRFHRLRGLQVGASGKARCCVRNKLGGRPTKAPRYWGFEFWKKTPGNPLNYTCLWDYAKFAGMHAGEWQGGETYLDDKYALERSELMYMDVPKRFVKKDDVIDWLLFESDFMSRVGWPSVKSEEELDLYLETLFASENSESGKY